MKKRSKEELLLELSTLLETTSIKPHIKKIGELRNQLYDLTTDVEELTITNRIKDKVQEEAGEAWLNSGRRGAIYIATGVGKTKIAIDYISKAVIEMGRIPAVIAVPTEHLRDIGWKDEFEKWGREDAINDVVTVCYNSLNKIRDKDISLVVLDEGHNITELSAQFFMHNTVSSIMVLTATPPQRFSEKETIFQRLGIRSVYELSLDEAVELGIVAPYNITVVTVPLDARDAYVQCGKKGAYFYQTEQKKYDYLTMKTLTSNDSVPRLQRMQFIYKLRSKSKATKALLDMIPESLKTLIFCANKRQAIDACEHRYFSKPTITPKERVRLDKVEEYQYIMGEWHGDKDLEDFVGDRISRLSCCEALNEGVNLQGESKIDVAFIAQLNSRQLHFIQRIGRILRYKRDHTGEIVILAVRDTVDLEWANNAISGLNSAKVRYVNLEDVLSGKEELLVTKEEEVLFTI